MNVPLALIIIGAGGLLVWAGIVDPPGGASSILGAMLRGEPIPKITRPAATPESLTDLAGSLGGAVGTPAGAAGTPGVTGTGKAAVAIAEARKQLGKRYVWGGNGPDVYDCSGLTKWCYAKAGITLPRTADQQMRAGKPTSKPQPGDLVFFGNPASHCGIFIGGGQMIHAPRRGDVVKVAPATEQGHAKPMSFRTYPGLTR